MFMSLPPIKTDGRQENPKIKPLSSRKLVIIPIYK